MMSNIGWTSIPEVFFTSLITAFLITPFMRFIAKRTGYLDAPHDTKVHAKATPLLGGVGVYLAFIIGALTILKLGPQDARLTSVFVGGGLLIVIGLIDDKFGMMPNVKLLGQFLAAMIMVKSGVRVDFIQNNFLSILLTYVWIIGITNAFNLLDNLNGLSAGVAAIAAFFFGIIAWGSAQMELAILSFAFCGACLGFLKHNFPKAAIFMGDSGSLFIGFTLSGIAILGSWKTINITLTLMVPILILAYPIFDTSLVTIMRLKERRSIFDGGKDHSSHRLALLGLKKKRTVLVIYSIGIICGIAAILLTRLSFQKGVALVVLLILAIVALGVRLAMIDTTRFGRKKKKFS